VGPAILAGLILTICSDLVQKNTTVFAMFFDIDTASLESILAMLHSLSANTCTQYKYKQA